MYEPAFGTWSSAEQTIKHAYDKFCECARIVRSSELHAWQTADVDQAFECTDALSMALHSLDPLQHDDMDAWLRNNSIYANQPTAVADLSQAHELLTKELLASPFLRSHASAGVMLQAWIENLSHRGGEPATVALVTNVLHQIHERKARLHSLAQALDALELPGCSPADLFKQAVATQLLMSMYRTLPADRSEVALDQPNDALALLCETDDTALDALCRAATLPTILCLKATTNASAEEVAQAKVACWAVLHRLLTHNPDRILSLDNSMWELLLASNTEFAVTVGEALSVMTEDVVMDSSHPTAAVRLQFLDDRLPIVIAALSAEHDQQLHRDDDAAVQEIKILLGKLNNCTLAVRAAMIRG